MSYRIDRSDPYANREDSYLAETIEAAAEQAEEWTGVGGDVILADLEIQTLPWEYEDEETGVEVTIRRVTDPGKGQ